VSTKNSIITMILGATALAGLTYGVARRGAQRRAIQPPSSQTLASSVARGPATASDAAQRAADWEALAVPGTRGSTPDPLDIALSLDGVFDGDSEDGLPLTVRPNVRVPAPLGGDDEDAPSADDLGLAWLMHATQTEQSLTESDLTPEIDDIALSEEAEEEADSEEEADAQDEHEDFRRARS
jgi:hypothetical protein